MKNMGRTLVRVPTVDARRRRREINTMMSTTISIKTIMPSMPLPSSALELRLLDGTVDATISPLPSATHAW